MALFQQEPKPVFSGPPLSEFLQPSVPEQAQVPQAAPQPPSPVQMRANMEAMIRSPQFQALDVQSQMAQLTESVSAVRPDFLSLPFEDQTDLVAGAIERFSPGVGERVGGFIKSMVAPSEEEIPSLFKQIMPEATQRDPYARALFVNGVYTILGSLGNLVARPVIGAIGAGLGATTQTGTKLGFGFTGRTLSAQSLGSNIAGNLGEAVTEAALFTAFDKAVIRQEGADGFSPKNFLSEAGFVTAVDLLFRIPGLGNFTPDQAMAKAVQAGIPEEVAREIVPGASEFLHTFEEVTGGNQDTFRQVLTSAYEGDKGASQKIIDTFVSNPKLLDKQTNQALFALAKQNLEDVNLVFDENMNYAVFRVVKNGQLTEKVITDPRRVAEFVNEVRKDGGVLEEVVGPKAIAGKTPKVPKQRLAQPSEASLFPQALDEPEAPVRVDPELDEALSVQRAEDVRQLEITAAQGEEADRILKQGRITPGGPKLNKEQVEFYRRASADGAVAKVQLPERRPRPLDAGEVIELERLPPPVEPPAARQLPGPEPVVRGGSSGGRVAGTQQSVLSQRPSGAAGGTISETPTTPQTPRRNRPQPTREPVLRAEEARPLTKAQQTAVQKAITKVEKVTPKEINTAFGKVTKVADVGNTAILADFDNGRTAVIRRTQVEQRGRFASGEELASVQDANDKSFSGGTRNVNPRERKLDQLMKKIETTTDPEKIDELFKKIEKIEAEIEAGKPIKTKFGEDIGADELVSEGGRTSKQGTRKFKDVDPALEGLFRPGAAKAIDADTLSNIRAGREILRPVNDANGRIVLFPLTDGNVGLFDVKTNREVARMYGPDLADWVQEGAFELWDSGSVALKMDDATLGAHAKKLENLLRTRGGHIKGDKAVDLLNDWLDASLEAERRADALGSFEDLLAKARSQGTKEPMIKLQKKVAGLGDAAGLITRVDQNGNVVARIGPRGAKKPC